MCGIAGILNPAAKPIDGGVLRAMTRRLTHRGPDEEGYHEEGPLGLGQRRLSIIDLSGGRQPIYNEDGSVCTVFNGEIFNFVELRADLEKRGHRFRTRSDTEVIVHGYEEWGNAFLDRLNGQFAIAVWDARRRKLILARDRVGIRPLFHATLPDGTLLFGSEMKSLFAHPGLRPEIDPQGVNQAFTFWVTVPPRTVFRGVEELGPGEMLEVTPEGRKRARYWKHRFPDAGEPAGGTLESYAEGLRELVHDAVELQLRADVPVAAYLSGGLDSSILSALVKQRHNHELLTFSVAFRDGAYDERAYQEEMVRHLGTRHRVIEADYAAIADAFADTVRFAEKPMIRTAPAPLYILAGLVRETGIKVVLTGEGADEIFAGYNIFKEDKVRRFWARQPASKARPLLLSRLYPYINKNPGAQSFWRMFFRKGMEDTSHPFYSHLIRWSNTAQTKQLFTADFRAKMDDEAMYAELEAYLDPDYRRWHPLSRAQYLEMMLFMSGYLLSSQGDRMMMGRSVEGRFPFLDHRLIEYAAGIPPKWKLNGLTEKYILKRAFKDLIPASIVNRPKQPYRAPISPCFLGEKKSLSSSLLEEGALRRSGFFDPAGAAQLFDKIRKVEAEGGAVSARDDMGLVGMVSLQLLHHLFLDGAGAEAPAAGSAAPGGEPAARDRVGAGAGE